MELVLSVLLAYIVYGISQVTDDLLGRAIDRPMWAMRPTLGKALFVAATWFTRPFLESCPTNPVVRGIAASLLSVTLPMVVLTGFIWCCIAAANYVFDSTFLRVAATAVLMLILAPFVLPLITILMLPLTLLILWPLDLLFPLRENIDTQTLTWCRTCKHHRKSKEYEDIFSGLWRSKSMPRSDKLPCNIALETSDVWKRYFSSEPKSRSLFPKDCPSYGKRA